ncbi:NUDIX domain-containing protein [Galbibacter sp. BG1]|uniref:NUDIX domain-containing protein n=1 Tax=Galbibacter sp. BG1 TaxID=1170699 RepID=UPI0015C062F0|nr:NUDIX domain-containing protein [Galbibacter sp. BG1]QLE00144.1 NUDIX domain-containing protein [Galbibacter sp. BG1]
MDISINIQKETVLSDNWYVLKRIDFSFKNKKGEWKSVHREVYDRGNGAAILLYNKLKKTVILTRQFRMPTYLNDNSNGMMIEVPAGIIENEDAETSIIRETDEETGYKIQEVTKVMETYTSPGAVTERLYLFVAEYNDRMKVHEGGGLESENEEIEVFEISFEKALKLISEGTIKDAKTIMLLQYAKLENLI